MGVAPDYGDDIEASLLGLYVCGVDLPAGQVASVLEGLLTERVSNLLGLLEGLGAGILGLGWGALRSWTIIEPDLGVGPAGKSYFAEAAGPGVIALLGPRVLIEPIGARRGRCPAGRLQL